MSRIIVLCHGCGKIVQYFVEIGVLVVCEECVDWAKKQQEEQSKPVSYDYSYYTSGRIGAEPPLPREQDYLL